MVSNFELTIKLMQNLTLEGAREYFDGLFKKIM